MSVREYLFQIVGTDAELNALGYTLDNGFAGEAPDSPPGDLFWVLRWGLESVGTPAGRGRGKATARSVSLWAYDRRMDYGGINLCLKRFGALLDGLEAVKTGDAPTDGWVLSTNWDGDGSDGYDDIYAAVFSTSSYTIVASGD